MNNVYYIMLKDTPTIKFTQNDCEYINQSLAPIMLRNELNYMILMSWLNTRVLSLSRSFAKNILNYVKLSQGNLMNVIMEYKGLSLSDAYWIKTNENDTWEKVNLFNNSLANDITEVAFSGYTNKISTNMHTPELNVQGTFAKCWRKIDNDIYLYKANLNDGKENKIEYIVSKIAKELNIDCVDYELTTYMSQKCCRCKNLANETISLVPIAEYMIYKNTDLQEFVENNINKNKKIQQMILLDGIVKNIDRHDYNWGMLMNNNTGKLLSLHPLFDHNMSLKYSSIEPDSLCLNNITLLDAAKLAYNLLQNKKDMLNLFHNIKSGKLGMEIKKLFEGEFEYNMLINRIEYIINN